MSPIKQEHNSSVERHMLANQKVWGSIPSDGSFFDLVFWMLPTQDKHTG